MKDAISLHYEQFKTVSGQAILYADEHGARLLPADTFSPAFMKGAPVTKKDQEDNAAQAPPAPAPEARLGDPGEGAAQDRRAP
jgi:NADH-quinone oxidoreductase subunit M